MSFFFFVCIVGVVRDGDACDCVDDAKSVASGARVVAKARSLAMQARRRANVESLVCRGLATDNGCRSDVETLVWHTLVVRLLLLLLLLL
jgi:hypothetical protein